MSTLLSISILGPNSDLLAFQYSEQVQKGAGSSKVTSAFLDLFDFKAPYLNNKNNWAAHLIYKPERIRHRTFFSSSLKKCPEKESKPIFHRFSAPPLHYFPVPFKHQQSPLESFRVIDYEAAKIFHTVSRVTLASRSASFSIILLPLITYVLSHNSF